MTELEFCVQGSIFNKTDGGNDRPEKPRAGWDVELSPSAIVVWEITIIQ